MPNKENILFILTLLPDLIYLESQSRKSVSSQLHAYRMRALCPWALIVFNFYANLDCEQNLNCSFENPNIKSNWNKQILSNC